MTFKKRSFKKLDYSYNHISENADEYSIKKIFDRAYTKSLRYLSLRPRSTKEIEKYLQQKEFDENIIQKVIELLISQKFLNDTEFTQWWIRGRQNSSARGKQIIKVELKQKGISDNIIEESFSESIDDYEVAKQFYQKKKSRFEKYEEPEKFQKAAAFLQRRGFSWDTVKKVLKDVE